MTCLRGAEVVIRRQPVCKLGVVFFLLALVSCGGERYELTQDQQGRTIRLDKRTGEVAVIAGDRLIIAKTPKQLEREEAAKRKQGEALTAPKTWPIQVFKQIGVTDATLTTSWQDGILRYQLLLRPVPKNYDKNALLSFSAPLTLKLYDGAGFEVISLDLNRSDLTAIIEGSGNRVGLSANSSAPCSQSDYETLAVWSLNWRI